MRVSFPAVTKSSIVVGLALIASMPLEPSALAQTPTSLVCNPSIIDGGSGGSATCTVTLSAAAPEGGTTVRLTSSLIELAASLPTVTVPAGQTTADFVVATNSRYRRYSLLSFSATIGATANGATRNTTLSVTAQPRPADFTSGSTAGSNTQWEGLMCGGIAPIGGDQDILYQCSEAEKEEDGFGVCTFFQECRLGCRRLPPDRERFEDRCATSGPNAVSISRNYVVGGDRVAASIVAEAPAGQASEREQGVPRIIDPNFNSTKFPQSGIAFPDGATSVPFDVATSYVPLIQFVNVSGFWFNQSIPPLLITNGRGGAAWLVLLPPDPPPAVAMPTLGDFKITGLNPVTGGNSTIGQIDLSGLSRAGGPMIELTSSHPEIVPPLSVVPPATDRFFGFQVSIPTEPPAVDTDVTITATDGRYSFSAILRVLVPPTPPVLQDVSVDPTSVVGGNPSTGTVTLSAPQSGDTVVTLSTPAPPSVATIPSSVIVRAGATSATFQITTFPVSETFNMNIFADLAGSPGQQALLLINPSSEPMLSALSLSPTSVVGGNSSTGTVTLSAAAPSGGTTVSLSDNASVTTVPESVTVLEGATSATFTVTTTAVVSSTVVTVTATLGGTSLTADLMVKPAASLNAISVSPSSVTGGGSSTGTVTLTAAAPAGGAAVSLASSNAAASVPASVTVAAGSTSANFTVNTQSVTASTAVAISATYNGVMRETTLTVNPQSSDTVGIQRAEYDNGKGELRVQASSTSSTATLKVFVTATDELIGTLSNKGGGKYEGTFSWRTNPQSITVRSSLGGSATRTVSLK